jgi:hypothetical protein
MLARGFNDVGLTVAINGPMWDNAQNCGKCIRLVGTGVGTGTTPVFGPLFATIDNVCPECKYGDIDLGLDGDGIWKMSWDFIDCGACLALACLALPCLPGHLPVCLHDWLGLAASPPPPTPTHPLPAQTHETHHPHTPTPPPTPTHTAEARSNGSILPIKGRPQNDPVRKLRALEGEESPALPMAGHYLAPGQYVTPEGIKDIAEVKAAATQIVN